MNRIDKLADAVLRALDERTLCAWCHERTATEMGGWCQECAERLDRQRLSEEQREHGA